MFQDNVVSFVQHFKYHLHDLFFRTMFLLYFIIWWWGAVTNSIHICIFHFPSISRVCWRIISPNKQKGPLGHEALHRKWNVVDSPRKSPVRFFTSIFPNGNGWHSSMLLSDSGLQRMEIYKTNQPKTLLLCVATKVNFFSQQTYQLQWITAETKLMQFLNILLCL